MNIVSKLSVFSHSPQSNFGLLLKEMRAEFDKHEFLITAAVSAGKLTIDVAYDIQALARSVKPSHSLAQYL